MTAPQGHGYRRFGLTQNPFGDLQSDGLEDAGLLHVDAGEDDILKALREDVLDRRRKAFVLIVGPLGAGKTHRLRVAHDAFVEADAMAVVHNVTVRVDWSVASVAEAMRDALAPTGLRRLAPPKWHAELSRLAKRGARRLDPQKAGRVLANALAANAPAALLLNDLQTLEGKAEAERMLQVLYSLQNAAKPGTLVMMTSYPGYAKALWEVNPAFAGRFDRVTVLRGLAPAEARLLIAKRLAMHRLVDDLDPLYPFTPEAIEAMVRLAAGSPREILRVAGKVLEQAAASRSFHINAEAVQRIMEPVVAPDSVPETRRVVKARPPAETPPAPPSQDEPAGLRQSSNGHAPQVRAATRRPPVASTSAR